MKISTFIFLSIWPMTLAIAIPKDTQAKPSKSTSEVEKAVEILKSYSKKKGFTNKVKVTTTKKTLGTKKSETGLLYFKTGNLNLTLTGDKKTEFIFDGKTAHLVTYPDVDFDPKGPRKVIIIKKNKNNQIELLSRAFNNPAEFFKAFIVNVEKSNASDFSLKLTDKEKKLKPLLMSFSSKQAYLESLILADELANEIIMQFEKPNFESKIQPDIFKFVSKKNDEIITKE